MCKTTHSFDFNKICFLKHGATNVVFIYLRKLHWSRNTIFTVQLKAKVIVFCLLRYRENAFVAAETATTFR